MDQPTIGNEDEISLEDRKVVAEGLQAYNVTQGYTWDPRPLNVVARGPDGAVVAALLGDVNMEWLFVSALWVAPESRRAGWGSRLIHAAEARARERGCVGMYLDTFSFQARPFYERLGFSVFGELEDCPRGGARYYLSKRF